MKTVKLGIVGTGWIAKAFADSLKYNEGLEAAAVCSRKYETGKKFADLIGAKTVFTDVAEMASSDEIEAVYIASPNSLHYAQSKLFLHSGKHVICEKPIVTEPEEFEELFFFAKEKKLVYLEAIMMMHFPNKNIIKNELVNLGKIHTAHIDFSQRSSKLDAYLKGELPNIFNPEFATGCLMDLGVYNIYFALYFFGMPEDIISCAGFLESGADGYGTAVFRYEDKDVTLTYSKLGQDRNGSQIFGEEGTMCIDSISKLINIKVIYKNSEEKILAGETVKEEVMSYEAHDFYRYITDYDRCFDEYSECGKFSKNVSKIMKKIRENCLIKFK